MSANAETSINSKLYSDTIDYMRIGDPEFSTGGTNPNQAQLGNGLTHMVGEVSENRNLAGCHGSMYTDGVSDSRLGHAHSDKVGHDHTLGNGHLAGCHINYCDTLGSERVDHDHTLGNGYLAGCHDSYGDTLGTHKVGQSGSIPRLEHVYNKHVGSGHKNWSDKEFIDYIVTAHEAIRASGLPNYMSCRIPIPSKINVDYLQDNLKDYEDKEVVEFAKFGWPPGNTAEAHSSGPVANHNSAVNHPSHVDKFVEVELKDRAIIGGFDTIPFSSPTFFSPLGTTEKKGTDGERRIIMDLSFPHGNSVNDLIPKDSYLGQASTLTFPRVDELVDIVRRKGQGCLLFKKDLVRAYRQIRSDVGYAHLLGFTWRGKKYFDISLSMGLRTSALCCQRMTAAIQHIYNNLGFDIVVYLDDLGGAEVPEKADLAYRTLGNVLQKAGFEAKESKSCPPSTKMSFLGVGFDTNTLTLEVTKDRLAEILDLLGLWGSKVVATRQEVQSIIGKLSFIASVVRPGRVFIARLLNFLRGLPDRGQHQLPIEFHKDLAWWATYLPRYNGVTMMPLQGWSPPDQVFASDACLLGCGAYNKELGQFFHADFPVYIQEAAGHISSLELLTVVVACKIWGRYWAGKRILVNCDNDASVVVMNSGRTRDVFMQACLRELEFAAASYQFEIKGVHIPGVSNRIPDALSRWSLGAEQEKRFWELIGNDPATEVFVYEGLFSFSHNW